jgi:hypothetical protein
MIGKIFPETYDGKTVDVQFNEEAFSLNPDVLYERLEKGMGSHGLSLASYFHNSRIVIIRNIPVDAIVKVGAQKAPVAK